MEVFHLYPVASGKAFQFQVMLLIVAVWVPGVGIAGGAAEMVCNNVTGDEFPHSL